MQVEQIQQQIEAAKAVERRTGTLYRAVADLAKQNGVNISALQAGKVTDFVIAYIEQALAIMTIVEETAAKNGQLPGVQAILDAIEDFFLSPDDIIPDHLGLAGLLDDAYLAHTLLATISGDCESQSGKSLLPVGACESNSFIRRLIGEPFVSMLDEHVSKTLEEIRETKNIMQMLVALGQITLTPMRGPIRGVARVTEITGVHL